MTFAEGCTNQELPLPPGWPWPLPSRWEWPRPLVNELAAHCPPLSPGEAWVSYPEQYRLKASHLEMGAGLARLATRFPEQTVGCDPQTSGAYSVLPANGPNMLITAQMRPG